VPATRNPITLTALPRRKLFHPAPSPRVAANGVEWLAVSGWGEDSLALARIQHPAGGLSRAYCTEDAPGRNEPGLHRRDSREKRCLQSQPPAEAVTGNAATPLVAIRQFHSNLVHVATVTDAARNAHGRRMA